MSPVSRGRRPKKGSKRQQRKGGNPAATPQAPTLVAPDPAPTAGAGRSPDWFGAAAGRVLAAADGVTATRSPQELDQAVAELLGAELHRALHAGRGGLFFQRWLDELGTAVIGRIEQDTAEDAVRTGAVWLLHGLAAQCDTLADDLLERARDALGKRPCPPLPSWLPEMPRLAATGRVLRLRDVYGTRFGVIAGYTFPGVSGTSWYLLDIDTSAFVVLADASVHDDPEQAAAAWREDAGSPDAEVHEVDDPVELMCLNQLDTGNELMGLKGDESRRVLDNWFRARTRINLLARTLRREDRSLPPVRSLYSDIDPTVMATPFTGWHVRTHGGEPDPEATEALAEQWMEGTLPETWFCTSPDRLRFQRALLSDWVPDHPVTLGVHALLPESRRLGERAGLSAPRMEALYAAAGSMPRRADRDRPAG